MDGLSLRVLNGQVEGHLRELKRRTVRRGEGKVPACFGLYRAENICRATTLVFVIAPGFAPRRSRRGGADVSMQSDRLLVHTNHRLLGIVRFFIRRQNVLPRLRAHSTKGM